jgi:hypothetical protein
LAGGVGPQGQTHIFTVAGAGSVAASAVGTVPAGATAFPQVYTKDEGVPAERGLGLCVAVELPTGTCLAGSDNEIGDPWGNIRANLATYNPSVRLDFTGLVAGSTVKSITLGSIQKGEAYLVTASSDGVNYSSFAGSSGMAVGNELLPTITIAVPATTKFLLISPNPAGGAGNNYLIASVTTETPGTPLTTWCSPGFWKNNGRDLWTAYHNVKYSTLVGAAPLGKKAPAGYDPTLLEVIDDPSVYGGPATNSVADFISNKAFGTPIGSGVESCPNPNSIIVS